MNMSRLLFVLYVVKVNCRSGNEQVHGEILLDYWIESWNNAGTSKINDGIWASFDNVRVRKYCSDKPTTEVEREEREEEYEIWSCLLSRTLD